MRYEFGVMSSKWELESKDLNSAKMAMVLFIKKDIPIVIYKPKEEAFNPKEFLMNYKGNVNTDEEARNAYASIKEVDMAFDSIKKCRKTNESEGGRNG